MTSNWDEEFDLVSVGSGGAGMLAAIVAADAGFKPLVIEKEAKWGGTSAYSGGGVWVPNNDLMKRDGAGDSPKRALQYLNAVIDYDGPPSSPERRQAYVENARAMAAFLEGKGFKWLRAARYPDYYPEQPGGMIGRGLEGDAFDGKKLGPWLETLAGPPNVPNVTMTTRDVENLPIALRTLRGFFGISKVMARTIFWRVTGRIPLGIGQALMGRLMHIAQGLGVEVRLSTPLVELVVEEGKVMGVVVSEKGKTRRIKARLGVVLAAGGFAQNTEFRRQFQPVGKDWTSVSPGDTGDAIRIGEGIGAATALMDDAWWGASSMIPGRGPAFSVHERSLPGCILVDGTGKRFVNESTSYVDVGHAMLALNPGGEPPPTWLIMDGLHRKHYMFGMALPGRTPQDWLDSGFMVRADTIAELADRCGIDPQGLTSTIERFNGFARSGRDLDFKRGDSAYDRYYSDPRITPNPNLAPIVNGPFYAVRMMPGDLGTKGGLVTDARGRVVTPEGNPIPGLYAAGNTTASVMGHTYPGPGSTLGPALTFAYLAARNALGLDGEKRA